MMHTHLHRALPAVLVTGGLTLAVAGVVLDAGQRTLPGSLLLVIAGAACQLHLHANRPRRAASAPWTVPPVPPRAPSGAPTQRRTPGPAVPGPAVPTPRTGPVARPAGGADGAPTGWRDAPPSSGVRGGGVRHRVLPHGCLPRQRRASDGS